MSQFIVHSIPGSPYGRAVLAALEEKNSRYRFGPLTKDGLKTEPHIQRHPFGRVPVLEHGDVVIYETQAILRYLDRVLPVPVLTPVEPEAAGRMDQLLNICDWYLMHGVNNVIGFHRLVAPRLLGMTPDEDAIAAAMPQAHLVFNEIARLLGRKTFLTGEIVSLADLLLACHLDFMSATPEWTPLTAGTPHLVSWLERMNARPSMKATTWERVNAMAASEQAGRQSADSQTFTMANQDYHNSIDTDISAREAFVRINAVSDWWTKGFSGETQQAGDRFTVCFGDTFVDFEVTEVVPEMRMVWQVVDSSLPWLRNKGEWTGTKVVWEASPVGEKTRIEMAHLGLVPHVECYDRCEAGWNFFVGESLRRLLTENRGMPDRVGR